MTVLNLLSLSRRRNLKFFRLFAASLVLGLFAPHSPLAQEAEREFHIYGNLEYGQTMDEALSVAEDLGFDVDGYARYFFEENYIVYDYSFYSNTRVYKGPIKFGVPTEIQLGGTKSAGLQAVIVRLFSSGQRPIFLDSPLSINTGPAGPNRLRSGYNYDFPTQREAVALFERLNAAMSRKYGQGEVEIGSDNLDCRLKKKANGYYEYEFKALTKYEPNVSVVIEPTCDVAVLYFAPNAEGAFEEEVSRREEESAEDF